MGTPQKAGNGVGERQVEASAFLKVAGLLQRLNLKLAVFETTRLYVTAQLQARLGHTGLYRAQLIAGECSPPDREDTRSKQCGRTYCD
jgi:hypothetical protein